MGLPVGATIGILGDGQLGRMLAGAASNLGFDVSIYGPEPNSPASRVAMDSICGDYDDTETVLKWAQRCDVVTYEFENVPVAMVQALIENGISVRPGAKPLEVAQDRLEEKTFLRQCDIQTADFANIDHNADIEKALLAFGGQGILKTRRDGYDGKGQARLATGDDVDAAHRALRHAPCILEALVPFEREISVIIARGQGGEISIWDCPENGHVNGILRRSKVPASLAADVISKAQAAATTLAETLEYVGVLALEFFVLANGDLIANEFAPRVHNSGHWTPEACETGQFEQHIRAVAGWPLGPVTRFHNVEMENLLGDEAVDVSDLLAAGHSVTLYGKRNVKVGRKMGHVVRRIVT
ncbi:MAG: 5-(carboxyamino)imidazole ribonucleotide synthase [Pseudomonadota bacterium]